MGKRQIKFYVEEEVYNKLKRLAEEQSISIPRLVKNITLVYLGEKGEEPDLLNRVRELERKYEQLVKEVGRIEVDLALLEKRCCEE